MEQSRLSEKGALWSHQHEWNRSALWTISMRQIHISRTLLFWDIRPLKLIQVFTVEIFIPYCLCLPSSDGYLVEWESYIVMTGTSCSRMCKCWILPRGAETVKVCSNTWVVNSTVCWTQGYQDRKHLHLQKFQRLHPDYKLLFYIMSTIWGSFPKCHM